jgi:hypothetical protein
MSGGTKSQGYTIVEVMVFLIISGSMFLMAAAFVNGKQGKAEFRQGLNEINQQVTQIVNDVNNGLYPWRSTITCTANNTGSAPVFGSGTSSQGENQGCVFLGKVIQFGTQENTDHGYNIYSVAARQYVTSAADGTVPTKFSEAQPQVIRTATSDPTEYDRLGFGLRVTNMLNHGSSINAFALFSSFGNYASGALASGAQNVAVVPLTIGSGKTNPPATTPSAWGAIQSINSTDNHEIDYSPDIKICFDGGNGQFGTLTIGNNGQRLATNVQIYANLPPGC